MDKRWMRTTVATGLLFLAGVSGAALDAQSPSQSAAALTLLQQGKEAMQRNDLSGAEEIFRHATQVAPDLPEAFLGMGLVQLRRGELEEATSSLTRATELNPQLPGAHLFLGIAQQQRGDSASAAGSLRKELEVQPQSTEALTWLGIVEIGAGHPELATAPLDQAAALTPKDPQILYYRARAHSLVAETTYRQLYQLDPDSALVHRALAETLASSGQPEKAIAEYEAAIGKDARNADLYEALGEEDQKIARFDAASKAYEQELQLNPTSAIALYNLGKIQVEHGNPEGGVSLLRRAQAEHAAAAPTDFYLGLGLSELGRTEEAVHWLELAVASSPSPFIEQSAYYQLARAYQKLNRKAEAERALDALKRLKATANGQAAGADASAAAVDTQQGAPQP